MPADVIRSVELPLLWLFGRPVRPRGPHWSLITDTATPAEQAAS